MLLKYSETKVIMHTTCARLVCTIGGGAILLFSIIVIRWLTCSRSSLTYNIWARTRYVDGDGLSLNLTDKNLAVSVKSCIHESLAPFEYTAPIQVNKFTANLIPNSASLVSNFLANDLPNFVNVVSLTLWSCGLRIRKASSLLKSSSSALERSCNPTSCRTDCLMTSKSGEFMSTWVRNYLYVYM